MKNKIIIAVVTIILVLISFKFIPNKEEKNLAKIFDNNKPILVEKDDLYGYINSKGKEITKIEFLSASEFNGKYSTVKYNDNGKEYIDVINEKGKIIYSVEYENMYDSRIIYYEEADSFIINSKLYNNKFKKISDNDVQYLVSNIFKYETEKESGIINSKGKEIYKVNSNRMQIDVSEQASDDNYYAYIEVEKEGQLINVETGKVLKSFKISDDSYNYFKSGNIFKFGEDDKNKYLYISDNKIVFEEYAYDIDIYEENILRIDYGYNYKKLSKKSQIEYFNIKTREFIKSLPKDSKGQESEFTKFSNYKVNSCKNGYEYELKKNTKQYLPCGYDSISEIGINLFKYTYYKTGRELIILKKGEEIHLFNLKNKKSLYKFKADSIYDISVYEKSTFIVEEYNDSFTIYNTISNKKKELDGTNYTVYSNYFTTKNDNEIVYYNTNLEKIYEIKLK